MGVHEFRTNFFNGDGEAFVADIAPGFAFFHTAADHATEDVEVLRKLIPAARAALGPEFRFTDELRGETYHALRWTAVVGGHDMEGVDLIKEAPDGRLLELRIVMRPIEGIVAFKQAMFEQFGLLHADAEPPPG